RWGGGTWNAQKAWDFLNAHVSMEPEFLQFELNRYLGWPGQAPSYKVGQRLWEQLRDRARERAGGDFDLAEFHRRALNVGSVGLDTLSAALDRWGCRDEPHSHGAGSRPCPAGARLGLPGTGRPAARGR